MSRSNTSKMAAAALLALVLAGCGGDSEPSAPAETSTSVAVTSASTSASTSLSPSTTAASAGAVGDFTKQGTKLKLGEKALVPAKAKDVSGILGVTATAIKKADPAELAPLQLGDKVAGLTPYYVTFVVTNESGTDFAFRSLGLTNGLLADGSTAQGVSVIGKFPPCPNDSAPKDFTTKGATYTTCELALAGGSSMVTGARYVGSSTGIAGADYSRDPITWK